MWRQGPWLPGHSELQHLVSAQHSAVSGSASDSPHYPPPENIEAGSDWPAATAMEFTSKACVELANTAT